MEDTAMGLVICYLLYHKLGTHILGGHNQVATAESGNERKVVPHILGENILPPVNTRVMAHSVFHIALCKYGSTASLSCPIVPS